VRIELPDMNIENFPIDGKEETPEGTIVGRYCKNCRCFTNLADMEKFAIFDQGTNLWECITCGGFDIEPIYAETHVKKEYETNG